MGVNPTYTAFVGYEKLLTGQPAEVLAKAQAYIAEHGAVGVRVFDDATGLLVSVPPVG